MAAQAGPARSVKFLIDRGADPRVVTPSGWTALIQANKRPDNDPEKALIIVLLEQALAVG